MNDFWDRHNQTVNDLQKMHRFLKMVEQRVYGLPENRDPLNLSEIINRTPLSSDPGAIAAEWNRLVKACDRKALLCLDLSVQQGVSSLKRVDLAKPFLGTDSPETNQLVVDDVNMTRIFFSHVYFRTATMSWLMKSFSEAAIERRFGQLEDAHTRISAKAKTLIPPLFSFQKTQEAAERHVRLFSAIGRAQSYTLMQYAAALAALAQSCETAVAFLTIYQPFAPPEMSAEQARDKFLEMAAAALKTGHHAAHFSGVLRRNSANMKSMRRPFFLRPVIS